ncbi:MAG: hypothetical protein Q9181_003144 [Wetmoreana brouardii]
MAETFPQPEARQSLPPPRSMPYPPKRQKITGRAFYEGLGSPNYVLAPMVDQSEFAWRLLTRSFLPQSQRSSILAYTPMLHARLFKGTQTFRDHHFQPLRTGLPSSSLPSSGEQEQLQQTPYLDGHPLHDRPLIVQFCANDPHDLLQAAQHVSPHCDGVDLNLGCPQGIARKGHYGSFLQESPSLIHSMVSTLAENLDVPVTAKMRILDTKEDTLRYARLLLDAGASWIAVHGRRREQKGHETGLADWSVIRYLREILPKETVIFANGNVLGCHDLDKCLEVTGADGVMSAEGNLCDPGIFAGEEGRSLGLQTGEYWIGKNGKGGWRMDAVMRRYLDILYTYVLEKPPPARQPLFILESTHQTPRPEADPSQSMQPPTTSPSPNPPNEQGNRSGEPPSPKRRKTASRPTSPNLLAIQPHLFHLLRPLLSTHTHIRDLLARTRPGDMPAYENILSMIEDVTKQGLLEYEIEPSKFEDVCSLEKASGDGKDDEESSSQAVRECKRPWWICQSYVRPLPKEALEKGSLQVGKKARKKIKAEQAAQEGKEPLRDVAIVEGEAGGRIGQLDGSREDRDERDGVPRQEVAKEAMVCG